MHNTFLIARHEYLLRVAKRSFILSTLAMPLFIVVILAVTILVALTTTDTRPVGYVDPAGILAAGAQDVETNTGFIPFDDARSAQDALEAGEIQAFYLLPQDYPRSRSVELYYWDEAPDEDIQDDFEELLSVSLAAGLEPDIQRRMLQGPHLMVRSADGRRELDTANIFSFILPFGASFLFIFTVIGSAGYLLQAVADEKENRTVEILMTTINHRQLLAGKALGLMAVTITQLAIWLVTLAIGLLVAQRFFEPLRSLQVPWGYLGVAALFFLPAYGLIAGLMMATGAAFGDLQSGQQVGGLFNLLFMVPLFFSVLVFTNPDHPLLVIFTLFPTTAFLTVLMRWGMGGLPLWQLVISWVLLTGSALVSVWLSGQIFRMGMLMYGQRIDFRLAFRELADVIRNRGSRPAVQVER